MNTIKVPKIIHFIWITPPPNGLEFNMHHVASIRSAKRHNPDYKIKFHCDQVPDNKYFDQVKDIMEVQIAEIPHEIFGVPVLYPSNKCTILRIEILIREGGVYQDLDIFTMRSYDELLEHDNCMGFELSETLKPRQILGLIKNGKFDVVKYKGRVIKGLCAGFIIAEKGSQFLKDWYEGFRGYDNTNWGFYSVKMPYALLKTGKYDIFTIPAYQAHYPSCSPDDLKIIFEKNFTYSGKYFLHTWEARSFEKYLKPLTKDTVTKSNTTYSNAIREYI